MGEKRWIAIVDYKHFNKPTSITKVWKADGNYALHKQIKEEFSKDNKQLIKVRSVRQIDD